MSDAVPKDHRDVIELLARFGYLARALVFIVIGYFAFRSAYAGGEAMSEQEAIREILEAPFGRIMLTLLVIALPSFAFWRYLQAFLDADGYGKDAKGLAVRTGRFVSGSIYLFLAFYAGSLLFGISAGASDGSGGGGGGGALTDIIDAWAPVFGPWFTIPAGILMLGVAGSHVKRAVSGEFLRFLSLPPEHARWMTRVCQIGLVARALVFTAIAVLFFTSVSRWSADDTPGIQDALHEIGTWPFGTWLLSATGAGLMAFGAYCLLLSRYGHIRAPDLDPSSELRRMRQVKA